MVQIQLDRVTCTSLFFLNHTNGTNVASTRNNRTRGNPAFEPTIRDTLFDTYVAITWLATLYPAYIPAFTYARY